MIMSWFLKDFARVKGYNSESKAFNSFYHVMARSYFVHIQLNTLAIALNA